MPLPRFFPFEFAQFPTWSGKMPNDEFFSDRVCDCVKFHYDPEYDWAHEFKVFENPPVDPECGKWLNRCMECCKCHKTFYQFFRHPSMGYHANKGWYCWNCLEMWSPPVVWKSMADLPKIPPPAIILPPGYELYQPRKLW